MIHKFVLINTALMTVQGRHTDRLITVCYLPVTLAMLLLMIHYNDRTNIALRIVGGMAGFCVSMIAVPVVSKSFLQAAPASWTLLPAMLSVY